MKTIRVSLGRSALTLLLGVLALTLAPMGRAATRQAILEAIHQIENPRDVTRPGKFGELGAYQFRRSTWSMHTSTPFPRALERSVSDEVAARHFDWISRGLVRAGVPASPYNIALAWNGGLAAAVRGRSPAAAHAYARRAVNLTEEFERTGLVAAK